MSVAGDFEEVLADLHLHEYDDWKLFKKDEFPKYKKHDEQKLKEDFYIDVDTDMTVKELAEYIEDFTSKHGIDFSKGMELAEDLMYNILYR